MRGKRMWQFLAVVIAGALAGCAGDEGMGSKPDWVLSLDVDGSQVEFPLEVLNVYLVEDESYPEIYEFLGESVTLVGEFPKEVHVGYGVEWERLIGRTISILSRGGDSREPRESSLSIPGRAAVPVVGGFFTVEKVTGKYAGLDGDIALRGRVHIRAREGGAEVTYNGSFVIHGVTWG